MSHIESGSSGGRRVNIELNLVPFIDLMSVLITFLLISAVWTQVQMIQMGSSFYGKKTEATAPVPTPHLDVPLRIDVKATGFVILIGKQVMSLPKTSGNIYDEAGLTAQLRRIKQLYPDKVDAALAVADDINYEVVIKTMDQILMTGFSSITFATGGPP
jgi:biopolymer transport protein TolR